MTLSEQIMAIDNKIARIEKERIRSKEIVRTGATGVRFTDGNLNKQIAKLEARKQELLNQPIEQERKAINTEMSEIKTQEKKKSILTLKNAAIVTGAVLLLG